jgi:alginate O-acetyltransferase complex protein AlgI
MQYKPFADQLPGLAPSTDDLAAGIRRILAGFIKSTVIANQLALVANAGFNLPTPNLTPGWAWLVLIAYTLQIYFDFSGYTDMAVGLGQTLGIRLPENFNYPYIAQSVSEFWRRWHMTLSAFFREYVFYPLERRRLPFAGQQINILIVFLLTGLWHGFNPTFIVWGLLHGAAIALESLGFGRWLKNIWRPLRHIYTLAFVTFSWIFFRANSLSFAYNFLKRLAGNTDKLTVLPFSQTQPIPILEPSFLIILGVAVIFSLPLKQIWDNLRLRREKSTPASFFLWQISEDLFLVFFAILGLALALSNSFLPNLYAKF